jgi:hypothetical protein
MTGGNANSWGRETLKTLNNLNFVGATWTRFEDAIRRMFGDVDPAVTARIRIKEMTQGKNTVDNYIMRFETYRNLSGYDDLTLKEIFRDGLRENLRLKIRYLTNPPATLADWQYWASRFERNEREDEAAATAARQRSSHHRVNVQESTPFRAPHRQNPPRRPAPTTPRYFPSPVKVEPKEPTLAVRRFPPNTCFNCGSRSHWANECPHPKNSSSTTSQRLPSSVQQTSTSFTRGANRGGRGGYRGQRGRNTRGRFTGARNIRALETDRQPTNVTTADEENQNDDPRDLAVVKTRGVKERERKARSAGDQYQQGF